MLFPLVDAPARWVVVARPDFGVSTRDAYRWWDDEYRRGRSGRAGAGSRRDPANDLEPAVTARHPRISRLISGLRAAGASQAAMSGSGSAVFGLFESRPEAERAAAGISGGTVTAWTTRTLTRRAYLRASAVRVLGG